MDCTLTTQAGSETGKQHSLHTSAGEITYRVIHRPKVTRRMHLDTDQNGELLVVVPRGWPSFYTARLLQSHRTKVERFLQIKARQALPKIRYENGSKHLFQGSTLTLSVITREHRGYRADYAPGFLRISLANNSPDHVKKARQHWYREQAGLWLSTRLNYLLERASWAEPDTVKLALRRMSRTWGTCSMKKVIRLNTHLIKAPDYCADYVIAHEICHLREMNHSADFYALQTQLWPQWREHRKYLRTFGHHFLQE